MMAHADETAGINHLASLIANRLYDDSGTEATICGPVIACNEWDDFEMTGFNYIMSVIYRSC